MVAMNVWPTDGADGSVASEARWRKMGRIWAPSGVIAGAGGEMAPSLAMPNLTVQSGAAWVDGHYTELASNQVLTATANGLAVIRFDPAANTADLLWRDAISVPAQSPTGTWELPIAKTTGSVLTDLRGLRYSPAPAYERATSQNFGGTISSPGQEIQLASFVMPIKGNIIVNGLARMDAASGTLEALTLVDVGPTSSPACNGIVQQYIGPLDQSVRWYGMVPFIHTWLAINAGTTCNLKWRFGTNNPSASVTLQHVTLDIRIVPAEF